MTSTPNNTETELRLTAPSKVFGTTSLNNENTSFPMAMQSLEETREPSNSSSLSSHSAPASRGVSPSSSHRQEENEETLEDIQERARREEEESIALARSLMAEEAMAASYAMSMNYLQNNQDQFSEEDLAALQAAMDEDQEEAEIVEDEEEGMSYELMLRLGDRLGDVKSERWARVAGEKINALPTFQFDPVAVQDKDENDCEVKCLVCQFQYEKDDGLRRLPCNHCFHSDCVDQWLMSKDFCPYCRTPIVEEKKS